MVDKGQRLCLLVQLEDLKAPDKTIQELYLLEHNGLGAWGWVENVNTTPDFFFPCAGWFVHHCQEQPGTIKDSVFASRQKDTETTSAAYDCFP
jgi:hypothetical protein